MKALGKVSRGALTGVAFYAALVIISIFFPPAKADDIEVYDNAQPTATPKVLLVIDASDSMQLRLPSGQTRWQAIVDVVRDLNADPDLGYEVALQVYGDGEFASGLTFPMADRDALASTVDSSITDTRTVGEELNRRLAAITPNGQGTETVGTLAEAVRYWAGREVVHGDNGRIQSHPGTWTTVSDTTVSTVQKCWRSCVRTDGAACGIQTPACSTVPLHQLTGNCGADTNDLHLPICLDHVGQPICSVMRDGECILYDRTSCYAPGTTAGQETHRWCEYDPGQAVQVKRYDSPCADCQPNYNIVLSDGAPSGAYSEWRDTQLRTLFNSFGLSLASRADVRSHCDSVDTISGPNAARLYQIQEAGRCGPELAALLANQEGKHRVITHTVGFTLGSQPASTRYLEIMAEHGGGSFFAAENADELKEVLAKLVSSLGDDVSSASFVPAALDKASPTAHGSRACFSVFKPSDKAAWYGNVKCSTRDADGSWDTPAGDALSGGFVSSLGIRSALTDNAGTFVPLVSATAAMLGIPDDDTLRQHLVDYANGIDVTDMDDDGNVTEPRRRMGDPLHVKPVIVPYSDRTLLYVSTNEGFLHAFDAATGSELWAWMPQELLPNLDTIARNPVSTDHVYGLDGGLTIWQDNDRTYLVTGMRRGGRSYYALDITEPTLPRLMWEIDGDSPAWSDLGQTWSQPAVIRIADSAATDRIVLTFGGGYDVANDDITITNRQVDTLGGGIYLVDPLTGAKVWSAGNSALHDVRLPMTSAIPSNLQPVDTDNDGLTDALYVGDMGGRLWRITFNDFSDPAVTDLAEGEMLGDFGGNGINQRRFFYPPAITAAYTNGVVGTTIAIGSGNRSHPRNGDVNDSIYFIDGEGTLLAEHALPSAGEKVLSTPLIFDGKAYLASYAPDVITTADACTVDHATGQGGVYAFDLSGAPVALDNGSNFEALLTGVTPPASPVAMLGAARSSGTTVTGNVAILSGREEVTNTDQRLQTVHWQDITEVAQ